MPLWAQSPSYIPDVTTLIFFYKHGLFLTEPGKEIEITTSKLTTMCLKYGQLKPSMLINCVLIKNKKCGQKKGREIVTTIFYGQFEA